MTKHVVLLGDSIFDNAAYVEPGQACVTDHMRHKIEPKGWILDMRAIDGDVVAGIEQQLKKPPLLPCDFVLSVGGNDALGHLDVIGDTTPNQSFASVLARFHEIRENFRWKYTRALDLILEHGQPLIVCTIYNPKFPETDIQTLAETGLSFFNDVIVEEALRRNLTIIDLREVCSDTDSFANPIEPSEIGGDRITDAIITLLNVKQV